MCPQWCIYMCMWETYDFAQMPPIERERIFARKILRRNRARNWYCSTHVYHVQCPKSNIRDVSIFHALRAARSVTHFRISDPIYGGSLSFSNCSIHAGPSDYVVFKLVCMYVWTTTSPGLTLSISLPLPLWFHEHNNNTLSPTGRYRIQGMLTFIQPLSSLSLSLNCRAAKILRYHSKHQASPLLRTARTRRATTPISNRHFTWLLIQIYTTACRSLRLSDHPCHLLTPLDERGNSMLIYCVYPFSSKIEHDNLFSCWYTTPIKTRFSNLKSHKKCHFQKFQNPVIVGWWYLNRLILGLRALISPRDTLDIFLYPLISPTTSREPYLGKSYRTRQTHPVKRECSCLNSSSSVNKARRKDRKPKLQNLRAY